VAFLGTPFQGSDEGYLSAAQLRIAVARSMGGETSDELVQYLKTDASRELDELVQRFCEMIRAKEFSFPIICFYETQWTDFTKVIKNLPLPFVKQLDVNMKGILVHERSACLHGPDRVGLDVKHAMLNKYADPKDDGFERVSFRLKEFAERAQNTLHNKS